MGTTILLFAGIGIVMTVVLEVLAGKIVGLLQVPAEFVAKTILYL